LEKIKTINGDTPFLFPSLWLYKRAKHPMSDTTMLAALASLGYRGKQTGHGFRGVAATILGQKWGLNHPRQEQMINLQIAHMARNKNDGAYDDGKFMPERTEMMQWWADYLDAVTEGKPAVTAPEPRRKTSNGVLQFPVVAA
jgi:hypothetical protein